VLSIGVVGVGRWGRNHVRVLKELEVEGLVNLKLVVDVDESRAKMIADEFKIPHYSTCVEDVSKYCDAAIVSVPIEHLYSTSRLLIDDGIHVLVEKPVACSSSQVLDLMNLAKSKSVVVMPGFIMRFNPAIMKLRNFISSDVLYIFFRRLSRRPLQARKYSILLDLAVHDIDLCMYMVGSLDLELLNSFVKYVDNYEICLISLRCGNYICNIHVDDISNVKIREVDVVGKDFFIRCDTDSLSILYRYSKGVVNVERVSGEEPLKMEDRVFIYLVSGKDVSDVPTLEHALQVLKIIEEISRMCSIKLIRD